MQTLLHLIALNLVIRSIRNTPTLLPAENFDAKKDADVLSKALADTKKPDNKAIKDVLSKRVCKQRVEIENAYRELFREELSDRIEDLSSRDYKLLLKSLFYCGDDLLAFHLNRALEKGIDRNKNAIEIMVTQTESAEKHKNLAASYERMFKRPYTDDLKKHLDGDFENVLLEMAGRERKVEERTYEESAKITAEWLNNEKGGWSDSRQLLDATLIEEPFAQLNLIFQKFKEVTGKEIEEVIKKKFVGAKENVYLDLIHFDRAYAKHFVEYYATRLKEAVDGAGTDELTLIRIILEHCENDIIEIEDQFQASYNRVLSQKIARDASGPFEDLLLSFLRPSDPKKAEEEKKP